MKRTLFVLLLLVLPILRANSIEIDGINYSLNVLEKTAEVNSNYSEKYSGNIIIPSQITHNNEIYTVTGIGYSAFSNCYNLTSVVIPNSVTSIGISAFRHCNNLASVVIPNSVTSIGSWAFSNCYSLTSVVIPNGVTTIKIQTFENCGSLTSITIPNSVTSIEAGTFRDCGSLTSINIPNSVTNVGESAFENTAWFDNQPDGIVYVGLVVYRYKGAMPEGTEIVISKEIKGVMMGAFSGCDGLTSIRVEQGNSVYDSRDNCNAIIETATNTLVAGCKNTVIPNSVTRIGPVAFHSCSSLTSIDIPEGVKSIGYQAFSFCSGLTSISIPNSVTSIERNVFSGCDNLASITFPESLEVIGCGAFYNTPWFNNQPDGIVYAGSVAYCYKGEMPNGTSIVLREGTTGIADEAFYYCSRLTSITIPNSVKNIGWSAFEKCSGLKSITISNSVTSIEARTFVGCSGLVSITIPEGVTSIGSQAFDGCRGLTSITIPNSVTSIDDAFYNCVNLKKVIIKDIESWFDILFDDVYANPLYMGGHLYVDDNTEIKDLVVPSGVTRINNYAFTGCSGLTSISIPKSVTSIGYGAFENCENLSTVTLPNGVTSIEGSAFRGCKCLTSIAIPDGVASIEASTFSGCTGLKSITIPKSVVSIGGDAFNNCISLKKVIIKDIGAWCGILFEDYESNPLGYAHHLYSDENTENCDLIIPEGVTAIGAFALLDCYGLSSVTIPNSVTFIGREAFSGCRGLITINIPNSVTIIEDGAFESCENLSAIVLPNSVKSIGYGVFVSCKGLTSITIANGVTSIEADMFAGCLDLTSIVIPESVKSIGERAFKDCISLASIVIPNSVTSIGEYAFSGCTGLESVSMSNSVTDICDYAFADCSGLTSIVIPNSVTSIGKYAFSGCTSLASVSISNSVTDICDYTFADCSGITSIVIPNGVTSIGNYAFSGCISLASVSISNSVTDICDYTFADCSGITSIVIPNGVTSIGNYAFSGCTGLTTVSISNSVANIGSYLFYGCDGLASIMVDKGNMVFDSRDNCNAIIQTSNNKLVIGCKNTIIPDGVTGIGSNAFYGCSGLTSITIPKSVAVIDGGAFSGCINLASITVDEDNTVLDSRDSCNAVIATANNTLVAGCKNSFIPISVKIIGDSAFYNCGGMASIVIPDSVTSIGKYAFANCEDLKEVTCFADVPPIVDYTTFVGTDFLLRVSSSLERTYKYQWGHLRTKGLLTDIEVDGFVFDITIRETVYIIFGTGRIMTMEIIVDDYRRDINPLDSLISIQVLLKSCGSNNSGDVIIPSNITYKGITFPVTDIGYDAFRNCSNLTSISIPNSIKNIEYSAFRDCGSVTSIVVDEGNTVYDSRESCNAIVETATNLLVRGCNNTIIPNNVTGIGNYAFNGCSGLSSITIPGSVTQIGYDAFSGCSGLSTIIVEEGNTVYDSRDNCNAIIETATNYLVKGCNRTIIPEGVTSIEAQAFSGCSGLVSITIPGSVTLIGNDAFSGCSSLTSISIPNSVVRIGVGAFSSCSGLTSIIVEDGNSVYDSRNNCNAIIETATNTILAGCKNTLIPNSVTAIGEAAFEGCSGLIHFNVPDNITSIGHYAFMSCENLKSITLNRFYYSNNFEIGNYRSDRDFEFIRTNNEQYRYFPISDYEIILQVPDDYYYTYRNEDFWGNYSSIVPISTPVEYEITLSDQGYCTFYHSELDCLLPKGLTAMVVEGLSNDKLDYKTIAVGDSGQAIPAGVPVMIYRTEGTSNTFTLIASVPSAEYQGNNLLYGSDEDACTYAYRSSLFYKLSYGPAGTDLSDHFGWYWGAFDGRPFDIEGHKAWLAIPKNKATKAVGFSMDGMTSVPAVKNRTVKMGVIYGLDGQIITGQLKRGIYIIDGKKVMINE